MSFSDILNSVHFCCSTCTSSNWLWWWNLNVVLQVHGYINNVTVKFIMFVDIYCKTHHAKTTQFFCSATKMKQLRCSDIVAKPADHKSYYQHLILSVSIQYFDTPFSVKRSSTKGSLTSIPETTYWTSCYEVTILEFPGFCH